MSQPVKIFLADLAHTYMNDDRSLPIPLNIGYIKAYVVAQHGDSVDIRLFKHPEKLLAQAVAEQPDIIGLSNYNWNQGINRAVGGYLRRMVPEATFIAGGPEIDITDEGRSAFLDRHDYLDYLVVDGGEEPVSELVDWWRNSRGDNHALPKSFIWRDEGGLHMTEPRPLKKVIEGLPSPYLEGHLDEFIDAGMFPLFETNRGCPFKCSFCAWGIASKDLVRRFDIEQVLAEIDYVGKRSEARHWIVCDANFGMLKRDIEIAKAIRKWKDRKGLPVKCLLTFAKNVTDRNIQVGEIMGDMTDTTLAVQSMEEDVLQKINRGNISLDAYIRYLNEFRSKGVRTYADTIVPLPGETIESHVNALRQLTSFGVDDLINHMTTILPGTDLNRPEKWKEFGFRSRFRLLHGEAGTYQCPDGTELRAFECEEGLRETSTLSEASMFFARKLHFLCDFGWNADVYKPLFKAGLKYGINPIDVMCDLINLAGDDSAFSPEISESLQELFRRFDDVSEAEWFDTLEEMEAYFGREENFQRLIGNEFDKMNIQFSVIVLAEYKRVFDQAIFDLMKKSGKIPQSVLDFAAEYTFSRFPPLHEAVDEHVMKLPHNFWLLLGHGEQEFVPSNTLGNVRLVEGKRRKDFRKMLKRSEGKTLSKVMTTQRYQMRELKLELDYESLEVIPELGENWHRQMQQV